jgi:hypothetical protein
MDRHEEAVMQLLTANGETFVAPSTRWPMAGNARLCGAAPARQLYVVEVSASGFRWRWSTAQ